MIVALLAIRFDPSERATGTRAVGLAIGFAGVVALVGLDVSGSSEELLGALMILLAAVGYAAGPMIINQRFGALDPRALMAVALSIATVVLTVPALLAPPSHTPSTDAILSIVVLGLFCTAAAFVLFGALIGEVGPGRATVITYISPIVAVALGVAVLDERPGAGAVAGLLLILAGSWLSTDGRLPPGLARLSGVARRRPAGSDLAIGVVRALRRCATMGRDGSATGTRTFHAAPDRSRDLRGHDPGGAERRKRGCRGHHQQRQRPARRLVPQPAEAVARRGRQHATSASSGTRRVDGQVYAQPLVIGTTRHRRHRAQQGLQLRRRDRRRRSGRSTSARRSPTP